MNFNFKSEEEVKDYINNLGIEYRFGCFKEKKTEVCHLLGDFLEAIDKNYEKAWKVYENNCHAGFAKSCFKCGTYAVAGHGGQKKDNNKALEYYEKSCNLGDPSGCFRAGLLSIVQCESKQPVRTFKQGLSLLEKGCDGNQQDACYHLSGVFMEGNEKEQIPKDMQRSFQYTKKACDLNYIYACVNLSIMYRAGDGVEKNQQLADKYKRKAQDLQDEMIKQQQLTFQQGLNRT